MPFKVASFENGPFVGHSELAGWASVEVGRRREGDGKIKICFEVGRLAVALDPYILLLHSLQRICDDIEDML